MNTYTHIIISAPWLCFRCVKGEGEIEKLQAKVVELRRKLDDTTAAMQELGRENQSLQVGNKTPHILLEVYIEAENDCQQFVAVVRCSGFNSRCPCLLDQAVPESDQEVGRGSRGAELHGLRERL